VPTIAFAGEQLIENDRCIRETFSTTRKTPLTMQTPRA
jgi:hypothetical protein